MPTPVRILDGDAVGELLTAEGALDAMRHLFELVADSTRVGYGRLDLTHPRGWLRSLPGFIEPLGVFGFKTLNRTAGVGMRYSIYVHDLDSGALMGIVDGLAVTNLRTGAVSALATEHLATPQVSTAALVGTGQVARGQLEVIDLVRPAEEVRVYARTPERRERFVEEMAAVIAGRLVPAASLEEAITGVQLVTLATNSAEAVLFSSHLHSGLHVNSVGPASLDRRELHEDAFISFDRIVCDSVDLVIEEAGDAADAVRAGTLAPVDADELSSVVTGSRPGRSHPHEITLFKSVGTGLQDLMVAARLLGAAEERGIGTTVSDFLSVKGPGAPSRR